jgi:putative addiction module killer protein
MYDIKPLPAFAEWLTKIKVGATRVRLIRRLDRVKMGLLGDVQPVGEGVYEMREHFGAGWRMY